MLRRAPMNRVGSEAAPAPPTASLASDAPPTPPLHADVRGGGEAPPATSIPETRAASALRANVRDEEPTSGVPSTSTQDATAPSARWG